MTEVNIQSEDKSGKENYGSGVQFEFYCFPCQEEGSHVEAIGYCKDCSEYLCEECYRSHRRSKPSRNHVLMNSQLMPKDVKPSKTCDLVDRCIDACSKHQDRVIEYYCQDHNSFACSKCAFECHRVCTNVEHISDTVDRTMKECGDVESKLHTLEHATAQLLETFEDKESVNSDCTNGALTSIKAHRKEIETVLDWAEKELEDKVVNINAENVERIEAASVKCRAVLTLIKETLKNLTSLHYKKEFCNLFVAVKKAKDTLHIVEIDIQRTQRESDVTELKFDCNVEFKMTLKQQAFLGKISHSETGSDSADNSSNVSSSATDPSVGKILGISYSSDNGKYVIGVMSTTRQSNESVPSDPYPEQIVASVTEIPAYRDTSTYSCCKSSFEISRPDEALEKQNDTILNEFTLQIPIVEEATRHPHNEQTHVKRISDIRVKTKKDSNACKITAVSAYGSGRILVLDYGNDKIRFRTGSTSDFYDLSIKSAPWDATYIHRQKIAVTLPHAKQIQFFDVGYPISDTREHISVCGTCWGISYVKDRLWVSYTEPSKVEKLTLAGEVQLVIDTDNSGYEIFSDPHFLKTSKDGEYIYVSDYDKNAVILLSFTGEIISVYTNEGMCHPTGIAVAEDGAVFVCDRAGAVHMLTAKCEKIKTLLNVGKLVGAPYGVAYTCNEYGRQLAVGLIDDHVKLYKLLDE